VNIVDQRLGAIHVFAHLESTRSDHCMIVVRSRHYYGIDVLLLLIEHLPPICVNARAWILAENRGGKTVIYVAQHDDPFRRASLEVSPSHSAYADSGNSKSVTRGLLVLATEHMSWDDESTDASSRKLSPRRLLGIPVRIFHKLMRGR
jgi:hypothetical protein